MPYNPGITYHGDQFLAQGLQSLGANISKAIDRKKAEGQEAVTLRKLASLYAPEQKDQFQTMSLKDLRAAAQAFAVKQQMDAQRSTMRLQDAQRENLSADNVRAGQFLDLQRAQETRAVENSKAREGFARDYSRGVPMVLRPDIMKEYAGPDGAFRYALGRNPGAITPEMLSTLTRYVTEQADPMRPAELAVKATNANAAAANASRPRNELTPYQTETLRLRERSLNDREAASQRRVVTEQLKALEFEPDTPETQAKRTQLQERLDALTPKKPTKAGDTEAPAAGELSVDDFMQWRKGQK